MINQTVAKVRNEREERGGGKEGEREGKLLQKRRREVQFNEVWKLLQSLNTLSADGQTVLTLSMISCYCFQVQTFFSISSGSLTSLLRKSCEVSL